MVERVQNEGKEPPWYGQVHAALVEEGYHVAAWVPVNEGAVAGLIARDVDGNALIDPVVYTLGEPIERYERERVLGIKSHWDVLREHCGISPGVSAYNQWGTTFDGSIDEHLRELNLTIHDFKKSWVPLAIQFVQELSDYGFQKWRQSRNHNT